MIFDRHSDLIDRTNRSAYAFRFGLRAGSLTVSTPPACKIPRKSLLNRESRSWIRCRALRRNPSPVSVRFRAICLIQSSVRLPHDTGDLHRPGLQVESEQHEVARQPSRSRHRDAEEVRRSDCAPVGLWERLPRWLPPALGSGLEPVVQEDALDCVAADLVGQVVERAADARVAPPWIRPRHRRDEPLDLSVSGVTMAQSRTDPCALPAWRPQPEGFAERRTVAMRRPPRGALGESDFRPAGPERRLPTRRTVGRGCSLSPRATPHRGLRSCSAEFWHTTGSVHAKRWNCCAWSATTSPLQSSRRAPTSPSTRRPSSL